MTAIYSIVSVTFFAEIAPELFGRCGRWSTGQKVDAPRLVLLVLPKCRRAWS